VRKKKTNSRSALFLLTLPGLTWLLHSRLLPTLLLTDTGRNGGLVSTEWFLSATPSLSHTCYGTVRSTGCMKILCSIVVLFQELQRNPCCAVWSTSSPSFFSHLGVYRLVSHTFLLTLPGSTFLFLEYIATETLPSQLLGSAVPCRRSVGAVWNWLCPAQDTPGLSSQRPPLQAPAPIAKS